MFKRPIRHSRFNERKVNAIKVIFGEGLVHVQSDEPPEIPSVINSKR